MFFRYSLMFAVALRGRAWIEIDLGVTFEDLKSVALRGRAWIEIRLVRVLISTGKSPSAGGRGLKSQFMSLDLLKTDVALRGRAWIEIAGVKHITERQHSRPPREGVD